MTPTKQLTISAFGNAPWTCTGYAAQAKALLPRFQALGHRVSIQANWGLTGGPITWQGMTVYPRVLDRYGQDTFLPHAEHAGADLILSFCDTPLVSPANIRRARWVPYAPVDHDPLPKRIRERLELAYQPLVYSRFAERVCREAGLDGVRYVTHPVDCAVFTPGDRVTAREACGFPQDRYLVGMVAMNKYTRKRFDVHLRAFKHFQQRQPDALLYVHTYAGDDFGGIDLPALCETLGLKQGRDVLFAPQYPQAAGLIGDAELAQVYRSLDVLVLVSEGEGFGIPIVEAQACGIPVAVGGWTSMPELCYAGAMVLESEAEKTWDPKFDSWHWVARPEAIAETLELVRESEPRPSKAARAGALRHDADRVVQDEWVPLLAELAERIGAES